MGMQRGRSICNCRILAVCLPCKDTVKQIDEDEDLNVILCREDGTFLGMLDIFHTNGPVPAVPLLRA